MIQQFKTFPSTKLGKYLAVIFLAALLTRLILFMLMLSGVGNDIIDNATPDVTKYMYSAEAIVSHWDFDTDAVYIFGPGYPLFLAFIKFAFGSDSHFVILFQILLSAIASVLLAKLAYKLTSDLRVSFVAGMLNALSLVSISLANTALSETLFFFLIVCGGLSFLTALERDRIAYSLLAGGCLAAAALTRSLGQMLFVILILMAVILYPIPGLSRWQLLVKRLKHILPPIAIIVTVLASWTVRNHQIYGSPYLAGAGPEGMAKLGLMVRSELEAVSFWDLLGEVREEVKSVERESGQGELVWIKHAQETAQLAREHPFTISKIYLRNVIGNANTDWGLIYYVNLPEWRDPAGRMSSRLEKKGLNYRVSLLALIGLVMLIRRRQYSIAAIAASIYLYFALVAGFAADQGMRIFYPGQIAWSIFAAYPLLWLYDRAASYWRKKTSVP